ncbi:MAG: DUF2062 domain-containing protein [Campylobacterales bacterium]|nr:DUF2062 domain-containing protein [Campylobacterales bacterium]
MIRRVFKNRSIKNRFNDFLDKYKIPREYLSVNRKSIARGLAVGAFWLFIPMPFQMLAVVGMTPFFVFNVPVGLLMVWISNPITMPAMYYVEYLLGNFLLGRKELDNIEISMQWFTKNWDEIFISMYVGAFTLSIFFAILLYFLANRLWRDSVKREKNEKDDIRRRINKES